MNNTENYNSSILDDIFSEITPEESEKVEKRMLLAAKIEDAIKAKGWRKIDLANAMNKRPSEITKWLSGTHNFNSDTLFDIERVLGINLISLKEQPKAQVIKFQLTVSQKQTTDANLLMPNVWNTHSLGNTTFRETSSPMSVRGVSKNHKLCQA